VIFQRSYGQPGTPIAYADQAVPPPQLVRRDPVAKTDPRKEKQKEAAERLDERFENDTVGSFDRDDPYLGWDAQQGALPDPEDDERPQKRLYADDPIVYSAEQLPDPEVLKEAGLRPVLAPNLVADDADGDGGEATPHDGGPQTANVDPAAVEEAREEQEEERKAAKKSTAKKATKRTNSKS
jgi:hypothetical protein